MRIILPTTLEDGPRLEAIEAAAFGGASWGEGGVSGALLMAGVAGVKAVVDNEIVGFGLWRAAGGEGDILTIATDPAARRQGVARAVLDVIMGNAKAKGVDTLFLEVAQDNAAAIALYRAGGFAEVGERANYYKSGASATLMKRAL